MLPISTAKNAPASRHLIEERSNSEAEEVSIKDFRQKNAVSRTFQRLGENWSNGVSEWGMGKNSGRFSHFATYNANPRTVLSGARHSPSSSSPHS
jgi:hypothetical protein